jgi:uncharacterized protein YukE
VHAGLPLADLLMKPAASRPMSEKNSTDPKFTNWFNAATPPAAPGVYQRQIPDPHYGPSVDYSYWDGMRWRGSEVAPHYVSAASDVEEAQDLDWRGLSASAYQEQVEHKQQRATQRWTLALGRDNADMQARLTRLQIELDKIKHEQAILKAQADELIAAHPRQAQQLRQFAAGLMPAPDRNTAAQALPSPASGSGGATTGDDAMAAGLAAQNHCLVESLEQAEEELRLWRACHRDSAAQLGRNRSVLEASGSTSDYEVLRSLITNPWPMRG